MEWIKNMPLKKALFTLALMNLLIAVILSVISFFGCSRLNAVIAPTEVEYHLTLYAITKTEYPAPTAGQTLAANMLSVLQIILPIVFFMTALLLTASLFYRWKLKEPLAILMDGADRIMENNLDFTMTVTSHDELGLLCSAFEAMRQSLLKNNQELWRQTEERKRLNAAFSHDLRNPVTIVKGSAKLAKQYATDGKADTSRLLENLCRIETYTNRIERYIEIMSTVSRLEQIQTNPTTIDTHALAEELEDALLFAAQDNDKQLIFHDTADCSAALLDKNMLFQIAENLTSNALRFAKKTVSVTLSIEAGLLKLEVADDGDGFSAQLLKNGIQPFQKGTEDAKHFGMGLYICNLLCQKHGGSLEITSSPSGAAVSAILKTS